jgi:thiamine-phosphate diphosphorylase
VRQFAPRPFRIGVSVGNKQEAAAALTADVDYWSIGSIYATGSKADAGQPIATTGLAELAGLAPKGVPVIGIGGIDYTNAAEVLSSGALGIAVISAVFGTDDVEKAARRLRAVVDEASASPALPPSAAPP